MSSLQTSRPPRHLAYLVAGFGMFGPFSIDAMFPGFPAISAELSASPIIRDLVAGPEAHRMIAQVMMIFAVSPAIAPIAGAFLCGVGGWRVVFLATGIFGAVLLLVATLTLPESLPVEHRFPTNLASLLGTYRRVSPDGIMMAAGIANAGMNEVLQRPVLPWAVVPFTFLAAGIALNQALLTLLGLERFPKQRGAAPSMQAFLSLLVNATVSGVLSPAVSQTPFTLSAAALAISAAGFLFWFAAGRARERAADAITGEETTTAE